MNPAHSQPRSVWIARPLGLGIFAVLLAACGGGGGGGGGDDGAGATMTLSGTAGKGILRNAPIEVKEILEDKDPVSRLASPVTTDANGNYTLPLVGYAGGPLLLTVSGGPNVKMKCDTRGGCPTANGLVAEGELLDIGAGFQMSALLPALTRDSRRCITPQSTVAARRAQFSAGNGRIRKDDARRALASISNLFGGLDVERACVLDITDPTVLRNASPEDRVASALAAGSLSVFRDDDGFTDPDRAVRDAAEDASDDDDFSADNLTALVTAARSELEQRGESDQTGVLMAAEQLAVAAGSNPVDVGSLAPPPNTPFEPIQSAKLFVSSIRTLYNAGVVDFADGAATQPLQDQLDAVGQLVDPEGLFDEGCVDDVLPCSDQDPDNVIGSALQAFQYGRVFYNSNLGAPGTFTRRSTDSDGNPQTATITVTAVNAGTDRITVSGVVGDNAVNLTSEVPHNGDSQASTVTASLTGSVSHRGNTAGARLIVSEGTVTITQVADPQNVGAGIEGTELRSVNARLTARLETINTQQLATSFDGTVTATAVFCPACTDTDPDNAEPVVRLNPDLITLNGLLTRGQNSSRVSFRFDLTNPTTFDRVQPIDASNVPLGSAEAAFSLALNNLPEYKAVINASVTGYDSTIGAPAGSLVVRLSRGSDTITLTGTAVDDPESDVVGDVVANVVATNTVGDRIEVQSRNVPVTGGPVQIGRLLAADGAQVGTITLNDNGLVLIRYADGTLESI